MLLVSKVVNFLFASRVDCSLKQVAPRGHLIALVGIDGSGKTTLARKLSEVLSQDNPSAYIYLGLGSGDMGRTIGKVPLIGKLAARKLGKKAKQARTKGEKIPGSLTALVIYAFSIKRYFNYRKMQRRLEAGVTVVTDRYPQAEIAGMCDGPGLSAGFPGNHFVAWLAKSEARLYAQMASLRPDLVVRLDLAATLAMNRKPDHDLSLLEAKIETMQMLKFGGAPMISIDTTAPFDTVWDNVSSSVHSYL